MRLSFLVALMVLIGFSAMPAMADSGAGNDPTPDPHVIIAAPVDPSCETATCFDETNSASNPLVVSGTVLGITSNFLFEPTDPSIVLDELFLFVSPTFPGQLYTCILQGTAFNECGNPGQPDFNPTHGVLFEAICDPSISACTGLAADQGVGVTVSPEPASLILFGTGLSLVAITRKRRKARSAA